MPAEVVFRGTAFPESLRWHDGDLWFSDVLTGVVYRGDIFTGQLHIEAEIAPYVSGLGWLSSGELLIVDCEKRAVVRQETDGQLSIHADLSSHWSFNANDMLVDADNTVWVGTYGFNPEGDAPVPADLARIANGATPDGLVVDNQGFAWVALAYSEAILRVNLETGEKVRAIEIPGRGVYDCTFGGPDLDKLYVATSDTDETHVIRDLPGEILCFDLSLTHPGVHGLGNK